MRVENNSNQANSLDYTNNNDTNNSNDDRVWPHFDRTNNSNTNILDSKYVVESNNRKEILNNREFALLLKKVSKFNLSTVLDKLPYFLFTKEEKYQMNVLNKLFNIFMNNQIAI